MLGRIHKGLLALALAALVAPTSALANGDNDDRYSPQDWPMFNQDALGTRANNSLTSPLPSAVKARGLEIKWSIPTPGAVNGTPAVVGGVVYAGDTAGNVYARKASNGAAVWTASGFNEITASVLVAGNRVIIGDLGSKSGAEASNRQLSDAGKIYGLYRTAENGHAAGSIAYVIDSAALGNSSPQLAYYGSATLAEDAKGNKDLAVIGLSSEEESATLNPDYPCCSFRGGVAAFDPKTGAVEWVRYFVTPQEAANGTSGSPVWSTPTYDKSTKRIYASTGNNYSEPANATSDAVLALNSENGDVLWEQQLTPDDTWNYQGGLPDESNPDSDIGDSVNVITLLSGRKALTVASKNGFVVMIDAATGERLSEDEVVPWGFVGGLFADSAYAYGTTFVNGVTQWCDVNTFLCADSIHDGFPKSGTIAAYGSRTSTLREQWRFETPGLGGAALSGLAVANYVLYAQAVDFFGSGNDQLFALNAKTGEVLTTLSLPQGISGPSIVGNRLYVGAGLVVLGALPGSINAIGLK